jgi:GntR family transcriptional regulator, transcriptional repressor for pyruvate dehydrogenase complex
MIVSGSWRPGDRLPKESELAAQLGLSRSSLREAVRALSLVRVLEVRQGDGTYVTSLEPDLLLESTRFLTHLFSEQTVLELFEVRRLLEPAATALAAVRLHADGLDQVRRQLERMIQADTVEELVEADAAFHSIICKASGNAVLSSLLETLSTRTMRTRIWRGWKDEDTLATSRADHARIYDALVRRDPELARTMAAAHVANVEVWLRNNLNAGSA